MSKAGCRDTTGHPHSSSSASVSIAGQGLTLAQRHPSSYVGQTHGQCLAQVLCKAVAPAAEGHVGRPGFPHKEQHHFGCLQRPWDEVGLAVHCIMMLKYKCPLERFDRRESQCLCWVEFLHLTSGPSSLPCSSGGKGLAEVHVY